MEPVRVLVVDDSALFRRLVADVLSAEPGIEVVGVAPTGRIALAKIPDVAPDLVTLDVEMPDLDGLATLAEMQRHFPEIPVVMLSSLTERAAAVTLDALALGAADYVTKPSARNLDGARERLRSELVPKIRAIAMTRRAASLPSRSPAARARAPIDLSRGGPAPATPVLVLGVGASTGGPAALARLLSALPSDFPIPILIVQHMPPVFTRLLAQRLGAEAQLPIREAIPDAELLPGEVWIAPGDHHLAVARHGSQVRLRLHQGAPENFCRPSVDVLFRSLARTYGAGLLAVILTGMGQDGCRACREIWERGGRIIAQDETTSVVWGMPGAVVRAGLADCVLPLDELPAEILRRVAGPDRAAPTRSLP